MLKTKKLKLIMFIMMAIFSVTFAVGVFGNPNFNIHDFCMNLASEILGLVITLVLVDTYVFEKKLLGKNTPADEKKPGNDRDENLLQ